MATASDSPEAASASTVQQSSSHSAAAQGQGQQNGTSQEAQASAPAAAPAQQQPKAEKKAKGEKAGKPAAGGEVAATEANGDKKLSGAELKKRAKEEKAARRAAEKAEKQVGSAPTPAPTGGKTQPQSHKGGQLKPPQQSKTTHIRSPSQGGASNQSALAFRTKNSAQSLPSAKEHRKPSKEVGLFSHLYTQPKRHTLEGVSKEVHPAVLALGLQMSNYVVCGSNARCVGMLLAFKKAIQAYQTPHGTSLARHLTSHHLSPQIDYLKSHRPISVSMGNAIRWLKDYIIHIDPDTPEASAKEDICSAIDLFIRERITVADTAIASTACAKIRQGSTVVTFGKSSIVEKTLLRAQEMGTNFKVIVIDSRPLFEGKNLARSLAAAGIQTSYMLHTAASHALKDADLLLLGAHAMMANGRLYSRVGTAAVAMLAHSRDVPVIVCCESIKFTDRVALDSIVLNEIAPPDELVLPSDHHNEGAETAKNEAATKAKGGNKKGEEEKAEKKVDETSLERWRDVQGLQLLNILYDVTPAEYINMVITEYGSLPPSSVPVVHRISTERDVRT